MKIHHLGISTTSIKCHFLHRFHSPEVSKCSKCHFLHRFHSSEASTCSNLDFILQISSCCIGF